jgi:hypothetical protein
MCETCNLTRPSFGLPGEKKRWCKGCAANHPGAVDVIHKAVNKMCEDCRLTQPKYNLMGEKKGRWCKGCSVKHRGAVDVVIKMCEDCHEKRPSYGMPEERKMRWCARCAAAKHPVAVSKVGAKKSQPVPAQQAQRGA